MSQGSTWSDEEVARAREVLLQGGGFPRVARVMGLPSANAARKRWRRDVEAGRVEDVARTSSGHTAPPAEAPEPAEFQEGQSIEQSDDGTVHVSWVGSGEVRSLADLERDYGLDRERWRTLTHKVTSWQTPYRDEQTGEMLTRQLWSVRASFVEREDVVNVRAIADAMLARVEAAAPVVPAREYVRGGDMLLEISVADHHFGLRTWREETGDTWSLDEAARLYVDSVRSIVERARSHGLSRILLVVGNDILHFDRQTLTEGAVTTRGTSQDAGASLLEAYRAVCRAVVESIDVCLTVAPVTVLSRKGNHDETVGVLLGEWLAAWYRNAPDVTVQNSPEMLDAYQHGNVLIGFCHGHEVRDIPRLSLAFATHRRFGRAWGEATHREIHTGHEHRERQFVVRAADEESGVIVRRLPSLCPRDSYHAANAYDHSRASIAFLWHPTGGLAGTIRVTPALLEAAA